MLCSTNVTPLCLSLGMASSTPFNERDAGLLMVFADPGKQATEAEFHGEQTAVLRVQRDG